ncbi:hypothetical protein HK413_06500 [Mucilaginibacter sp. S1162]|uniref:Uncharacterized protein n=1 Tax=Mucilaginibacter humi TaxID=2732510 RepID=A0ABX1W184_9SPHI|nr:hypothetical protein [Mucilaginibacter humi]NNU33880.1 hypothetical protein [Mucilaginibacter humi]
MTKYAGKPWYIYYEEHQASSYDRHSISPDQPGWFANADASQYIRTETVDGRRGTCNDGCRRPGRNCTFLVNNL